jgi:hypothetical protein
MVECGADIAINYEQNGYSDLYCVNLAGEMLVPVCTSQMKATQGAQYITWFLQNSKLLDDSWTFTPQPSWSDWRHWRLYSGLTGISVGRRVC